MFRFKQMFTFRTRKRTKTARIIALGLFVHLCVFLGVLDVYFSSPVETGLKQHRANLALSDRVVIFVADGLRYESMSDENFNDHTPFLNKIRREYGSWGKSTANIPTESRPGHIALFGGMFEDPRALLSGWQKNPINVDNVFNQSDESWLWGSPDIVPLFNKDDLDKIHTFHYSPSFEDFSGSKLTTELDRWVFESVETIFYSLMEDDIDEMPYSFFGPRRILFLHLLGMDTVGHVFKPNSKEYINNLKFVDNGIEKMHTLFEEFFNDDRTTYIFTSDHGMTDWGSHGSSSDHETNSPFIAWGSGILNQRLPINIQQVDVTPLISSLLGINIPINSVGLTPWKYLDITESEIVDILYSNVKQLAERFRVKHARLESTTVYGFFEPFKKLDRHTLDLKLKEIDDNIQMGAVRHAKKYIVHLIKLIREGDKYVQDYYKYPLLFALSLGILLWLIFLIFNILPAQELQKAGSLIDISVHKHLVYDYGVVLITLIIAFIWNGVQFKYQCYILFPALMVFPILYELNQLYYCFLLIFKIFTLNFFSQIIFCLVGLYLLTFSFHNGSNIYLPMILLVLWSYRTEPRYNTSFRMMWIGLLLVICFYSTLSTFGKIHELLTFIGAAPILYIMELRLRRFQNSSIKRRFRRSWQNLYGYTTRAQYCLIALTIFTSISYDIFKMDEHYQYVLCVFSWIFLGRTNAKFCVTDIVAEYGISLADTIKAAVAAIAITYNIIINDRLENSVLSLLFTSMSPRYILTRTLGITVSLYAAFIMMCINGESAFLAAFILLQMHWVDLELIKLSTELRRDINDTLFGNFSRTDKKIRFDDFRRCLFFMYFILLSYFGIGNTANINTFNPMWARQFVIIFNPGLSMIIILLKLMIPFLITTVHFQALNIFACSKTINIFSAIMMYCDILIVYFMYTIQNEGSWLDMGLSISRFIVMIMMTLALLLFYGTSKFLTENKVFDFIADGVY